MVLYITKCQADLWPLIQGHSFGPPHTYLIIFLSELTGVLDCLGHLTKMAATPYMVKENMFHYKL